MMRSRHSSILVLSLVLIGIGMALWGASHPQLLRPYASFPQCPDHSASCRWDPLTNGIRYGYLVQDETDDSVVAQGETTSWWVRYTPQVGHTYLCRVTAVNACGSGPASEIRQLCDAVLPSKTPTPGLGSSFLRSRPGGATEAPTAVPFAEPSPTDTPPQNFPVEPKVLVSPPWWRSPAVLTNLATYLLLVLLVGSLGLIGWQKIQKRKGPSLEKVAPAPKEGNT